ncbi:hypothetical protein [Bacillus sp. 18-5]|uniref:hypothetical protein n=1 Tax=Bacillus sp. 18-5 TaxID=3458701 RepID=UPI00404629A2
MLNFKIVSKIAATLLLGCILYFVNTEISQASENTITKEELQQQKENFMKIGIDEKTAEKLTQKVAKGEMVDAQKESEVAKRADQLTVSTDTKEKYIEFDDGSRINLSVEDEDELPPFQAFDYATGTVKKLSCTSGSGYRNCRVKARYHDGIWDVRFEATVSTVSKGYDSISKINKQAVDAVLYNVTEKKFKLTRKTETKSHAARADYTNQFTHKTGLYSVSRTLTLYAQNDKTFARLNYY